MKKLLLVTLAACAPDVPAETTVESPSLRRCSLLVCGENAAASGDGHLFDELDLNHQENYAGVRLLGGSILSLSGRRRPADVRIDLDVLRFYDPATGGSTTGHQLVNRQAMLHFDHPETGELIDLLVTNYSDQIEWFRSGSDEYVPAYQFYVRQPLSEDYDTFEPICTGSAPGDGPWAVVFRGDRYTSDLSVVATNSNKPTNGWSFLACNGSAAMKMHLQRHTYAGGFDNLGAPVFMTTEEERTTLLKAITADYCGIGHSFTATGTRLAFATAEDPVRFPEPYLPSEIDKVEALWTPYGAACIDTPRLAARSEIDAMCSIPDCGIYGPIAPWGWESAFHAITAVPFPVP